MTRCGILIALAAVCAGCVQISVVERPAAPDVLPTEPPQVTQARIAEDDGRFADARALYAQLVEHDPYRLEPRHRLAV
ncbi:MAG: hypothetical protein KY476_14460, partial [Planctomycetes bacterium]|nr:hypothetical protein [Planctomycetota bacterium]